MNRGGDEGFGVSNFLSGSDLLFFLDGGGVRRAEVLRHRDDEDLAGFYGNRLDGDVLGEFFSMGGVNAAFKSKFSDNFLSGSGLHLWLFLWGEHFISQNFIRNRDFRHLQGETQ